mmetsp:Transcript_2225/g.3806  ORF Transcript_2225/g.3806 Transcript_2225/m.3806 type:complete len:151 (+) Transcript_2225:449-901(+)
MLARCALAAKRFQLAMWASTTEPAVLRPPSMFADSATDLACVSELPVLATAADKTCCMELPVRAGVTKAARISSMPMWAWCARLTLPSSFAMQAGSAKLAPIECTTMLTAPFTAYEALVPALAMHTHLLLRLLGLPRLSRRDTWNKWQAA